MPASSAHQKLATYRKKRDFSATREPLGKATKSAAELSFVVQKHAASHLHYDFRLELDGVLLSWAVPKGPSLDPSVKRLAMETEPHPLDYGGFEGTIPQGHYGGGAVMVWDRGHWSPEGDPRAGYKKGHLNFTLEGDKLQGAWHLVRTQRGKDGRGWLLFKSRDEFSREGENFIVEEQPDSALTGRSIQQIAADAGEPVPKSAPRESKKSKKKSMPEPSLSKAKKAKLPQQVELELATLVDEAPEGEDWLHEIKFDGYRLLARLDGGDVTLSSRNAKDWTERVPVLVKALEALHVKSALIDGELVALNEEGLSDFQALQNSLSSERVDSLVFYAFDLLHLDGHDLTPMPLSERKALLAGLLARRPKSVATTLRLSEHVQGGGPEFFRKASELGLEGIVSKRADSAYRGGRGRAWLKIKSIQQQEFVVVGYTDPSGSRNGLGALLLAVRKGKKLRYAGRVGTGFTQRTLTELHAQLEKLHSKEPSVDDPPHGAAVRDVHWVRAQLVAEVAFTGFTEDGLLRHPRFVGLREDKKPSEVVLEEPAAPPKAHGTASKTQGSPPKSHGAASKTKPAATKATGATKAAASKTKAASIELTNPDKVLFPELGITKRELLAYYELVAERMLPHVQNRPLTLVRCPNGWNKSCFFQKHPGKGMPASLRSISIREKEGKAPYAVLDDAEGLFSLVQLGALEVHTWGSRADDFERPDILVFDLDPDPSVKFAQVIAAAQRLRELFDGAGLESFVKTTGGKGLHVCVPIVAELEWPQIKEFCKQVVDALVIESPEHYVGTQSKAKRRGKIFIDYLRNARGATFIAPYSTRARENAPVAAPLEWEELDEKGFHPAAITVRNVKQRLAGTSKDPFARLPTLKQHLSALKPSK